MEHECTLNNYKLHKVNISFKKTCLNLLHSARYVYEIRPLVKFGSLHIQAEM